MTLPVAVRFDDEWVRARREGIRIFGAGTFAQALAAAATENGIQVHSFLLSGMPDSNTKMGIPVRMADAAALEETATWIGVFNRHSASDYAALRNLLLARCPAARLIWPQQYYGSLHEQLGWRFWLHPPADYLSAAGEIERARATLEDSSSRDAFDAVIEFRRSGDSHWKSPAPTSDVQYMPGWLQAYISKPLKFVDAGAYHGETLQEVSSLVSIEQAWAFEPDLANFSTLVRHMSDWTGSLVNLPLGLADHSGTAAFAADSGEASSFAAGGTHRAPIVALDDCLHFASVNFLKLDVEGNELAALRGAVGTLRRERPTLAIAGYHRWDDLWRIPCFIMDLKLDYRLRLCLHGHNSFDCVFYAY